MGCTTSSQLPHAANENSIPTQNGHTIQQLPHHQSHLVTPAVVVSSLKVPDVNGTHEDDDNDHAENLLRNNTLSQNHQEKLDEPKSRTASAQSVISNISTAAKGIAYEFKIPSDPGGPSIVKAHPPKALKRLEMPADMKLTFESLNNHLKDVEQRKAKLIAEKQERIKTMSSGRAPLRPKTAAPKEEMQERLETKLADAEERQKKMAEETAKRQEEKSARAKRVREKAEQLKNPAFVDKMDTFGTDGNLEAPLTPPPEINKTPTGFAHEAQLNAVQKPEDAFFD